ncbi:MAG: hypothetical protein WD226_11720 [Planctomycetota bacterium]
MSVSLEFEVETPGAETDSERVRIDARRPADLPERVAVGGGGEVELRLDSLTAAGGLLGCVRCGHAELFRQKDFPRKIGIGIVVSAAVLAPFTMYISLGVAALADYAIYHLNREMVVCYVCHTRHRGFAEEPKHPRFDREIDERLKYGEKAVMGKPMRPGGTAGAPEPEH